MARLFIAISYPVVFLIGWIVCAVFAVGSKTDNYQQGYRAGEREGYRNGYMDCYRGFMGESTCWGGEDEN